MLKNGQILEISNAEVIFKNFAGRESDYNAAGSRNFGIKLDKEQAEVLASDGWKVKSYSSKDDPTDITYWMPVTVRYDRKPPRIYMRPGENGPWSLLDESTVSLLDDAEIEKFDIAVTASYWERANGDNGFKTYAYEVYATLRLTSFAMEYGIYGDMNNGD